MLSRVQLQDLIERIPPRESGARVSRHLLYHERFQCLEASVNKRLKTRSWYRRQLVILALPCCILLVSFAIQEVFQLLVM